MAKTKEQRLVEELVAHAAVEALAEGVLHRLARRDVMPGDALGLAPGENGVRGELGAIVGDDDPGTAAAGDERCQFARHSLAGDRRVGDREQTLARGVVDHVENAEAPSACKLVVHEVERPAGVRLHSHGKRRSGPDSARRRPLRLRTARPSAR